MGQILSGGLNGLGLFYSSPAFSLEGSILRETAVGEAVRFQYGGTVLVRAAKWQLQGIASYALLKDGGSSLFLFMRCRANLGGIPAFQLQGIMGGMGIDRRLRLPTAEQVEKFPLLCMDQDSGMSVLASLEGNQDGQTPWLTTEKSSYWAAAGVEFSSFGLVSGKLLMAVTFGRDLTIALAGSADFALPKGARRNEAYAWVRIMLSAVLQPSQGVLSVDARLSEQSFLLSKDCHVQGGGAFYLWFGSNEHAGDFVLTIGGYHPHFMPPAHYPKVDRIGFQWRVSQEISAKGEAYLAVTPASIMAGGRLEFLFAAGIVKAWFIAYADILAQWHPFWFET